MSFPTVLAVNGGNATVDATSVTINLPDGSNTANRLILLFFTSDGSGESFTWPTGFTEILVEGGTGFTNGVAYQFTTGSEGYASTGATTTLTITSVEQSAHTTYLLSGVNTATAPEAATATTGTSTAPNSGSLNPAGWGTEDTLWFTFASANGLSSTTPRFSAYPTNYTSGRSDISAGGNGVVQGVARRELNAASEDPGAFTLDTSAAWRASTIGVRPSATVYTLSITSASISVTASAVGLLVTRNLAISSQSISITASAVNLLYARRLSITSQSYTVTSSAVGLLYNRVLSVASSSYSVTAQAIGIQVNRLLTVASQSYIVSAGNVGLLVARVLSIASQSLTVTANDIALTPSGSAPVLTIETQGYTVTANNITLTINRRLTINTASISATANDVNLIVSRVLSISSNAITTTFNSVLFIRAYLLAVQSASITLATNAISFLYARVLGITQIALEVTANNVIFSHRGAVEVGNGTRINASDRQAIIPSGHNVLSVDNREAQSASVRSTIILGDRNG
jgi:hypothetical protein